MSNRKLTPKVKELLAHFIALEAVPIGGNLSDGLDFLTNPERRQQGLERAIVNVEAALVAVKSAPDNPYGDDDEVIAAAILERVEHKRNNAAPDAAQEQEGDE